MLLASLSAELILFARDAERLARFEREAKLLAALNHPGIATIYGFEQYRARDTKLQRDVAVKVLPDLFARDAERLARFEREAKLLAALNHPGIATIYGFEQFDGTHFLVMELVEGETLAERIARGPIPLDEAIELFTQIAEALDAAHEKGIVHRDIGTNMDLRARSKNAHAVDEQFRFYGGGLDAGRSSNSFFCRPRRHAEPVLATGGWERSRGVSDRKQLCSVSEQCF